MGDEADVGQQRIAESATADRSGEVRGRAAVVAAIVVGAVLLVLLACVSGVLALGASICAEAPLNAGHPEQGLLGSALGLLIAAPVTILVVFFASGRARARGGRLATAGTVWVMDAVLLIVMALLVITWNASAGWEWNLLDCFV